ncbi:MAG TPA: hypothetical protein VM598_06800 [Bdellovibrionota bacterium]|nr:hypothetical protein [Bdellovibrionota bacterium]
MKSYSLGVVVALIALASPAVKGDTPGLRHWVNESEKTVFVSPRGLVKVILNAVEAEDELWDYLTVELTYDSARNRELAKELADRYPGYRLRQVITDLEGDFRLSIPVAGIELTRRPLPGQSGPFFWQDFGISKAKSPAVHAAIVRAGSVVVEGTIGHFVPTSEVLERAELGPSACAALGFTGDSVYKALQGYVGLAGAVAKMEFRHENTRLSAMRSVFASCLKLEGRNRAGSIRELLGEKIARREDSTGPVGETRRESITRVIEPLLKDYSVEIIGRHR